MWLIKSELELETHNGTTKDDLLMLLAWLYEYRTSIELAKENAALRTPAELAELVKAREENRILPEGFTCTMSADDKTLYAWYPEGNFIATAKQCYITPGGGRRCGDAK